MEINLTFLRSLMQKLLENPNVTEWYLFYLRVINVKAERGVSHNRIITIRMNINFNFYYNVILSACNIH